MSFIVSSIIEWYDFRATYAAIMQEAINKGVDPNAYFENWKQTKSIWKDEKGITHVVQFYNSDNADEVIQIINLTNGTFKEVRGNEVEDAPQENLMQSDGKPLVYDHIWINGILKPYVHPDRIAYDQNNQIYYDPPLTNPKGDTYGTPPASDFVPTPAGFLGAPVIISYENKEQATQDLTIPKTEVVEVETTRQPAILPTLVVIDDPVLPDTPAPIIAPGDPTINNFNEDKMRIIAPIDEEIYRPIAPGDPTINNPREQFYVDPGEPSGGVTTPAQTNIAGFNLDKKTIMYGAAALVLFLLLSRD